MSAWRPWWASTRRSRRTPAGVAIALVVLGVVATAVRLDAPSDGGVVPLGWGNVFDKAVMENDDLPFPEVVGIIVHGVNGGMVIPVVALLLLIVSFFARVPRGVAFAAVVLLLVAAQAMLGYAAHGLPWLGALHGLNAMLLFAAALHAARRARPVPADAPVSTAGGHR
ncbi:hypothetical protein [Nonomuraea sp. CA-141351]|uniref:hypothetical protein n=1 Tax=Nonomuraea sp. CA-141351 TaxID=3239996 RepID=UPI003D89FD32